MAWNVGVLGLTHDHVWEHVGALASRDDVTLSVADPNAPLLEKARAAYGVERGYADYAALLERENPDAVLVFADNAGSVEIVELAVSRGKPVMLEKPLADSLAGAERIRVAVCKAGLPLMVNWPTNWTPAVRHALDLAASGAIGDIYRFSFRGGHGGPKEYGCSEYFYSWLYDRDRNGAGAYIDYCGYGAVMAQHLLGLPTRAQATIGRLQKDYVPVDDNAILVLRYPTAMAVIEATWTANGPVPDGGPAIWGSHGSLVVQRQAARREGQIVRTGVVKRITKDNPDGEIIEPPDFPEGSRSATEYFLNCLASDRPFEGLVSLDTSLGAQEILEAGLIAARAGSEVSLPLDVCNWR
ncbi:MAG: Gfo/Idh/MocA family oxidoreductase [Thermomicrobiales bacterium]